jgi:magnesium chelatase family protein
MSLLTGKQGECAPQAEAIDLLNMAVKELELSVYTYDRILKLSRTIANLEESDTIEAQHVSEAIQYYSLDRTLWD